jgi:hypothetical protein
MRQVRDDERRINPVRLAEQGRGQVVVRPQQHADREEQRKLHQHCYAACNQSRARLLLPARCQQPLHDELIGTVTRHCEKRPANHSRPECIGNPDAPAEIKHL